jgi:cell division protein FtsN
MSILNRKRQGGGTVLGLILGLIIGLSIAVVVAIMIKNTPLPFTNKVGRPEKGPDAAASAPISDPNKGLYGNKGAAREAAKQFAKPEEAKPAEASVATQAPTPAPKEAAHTDKPAADGKAPVVDKSVAATRLAKADPAPAAADEKFTYYLQAGAFLEQADAENTKAKLALMGVPASIAERKSDNGTLFRVRIGPFAQPEAMNRVRGKLTDNGVDVAVVRVPK